MLRTRALVAAIALPLLVGAVWVGGWLFAGLVLVALLIAGHEYAQMWRHNGYVPPLWMVLALIALPWASVWFDHDEWREPGLVLLLIAGMLYAIWRMEQDKPLPIFNVILAVFGGVYIGWLGQHLLALRLMDDGVALLLYLYGCIILVDSAAYFVGRLWGTHRMAPHVSPKKTWEGYIGGVIGGVIYGALAASLRDVPLTPTHGAIIGLMIGVFAAVGDLGISAIKRQVGVKDSGNLIPGHGGILDRLDSVLVGLTLGYYYVQWLV